VSNEKSEPEVLELDAQTVGSTALESIERAQNHTYIEMAHKYKRSITEFIRDATEMAIIDEETAESCFYSRPVGGGKYANGNSIRFAEIAASCYRNIVYGGFLVEMTDRYVKARGFAFDYEKIFSSSSEVMEPTINKDGKPYTERHRAVIAKAAIAKARRDAIFQIIPKALCKPIENDIKKLISGEGNAETMSRRRDRLMKWINGLGIDVERVFKSLNIGGEMDIDSNHLALLTGLKTSIKEGDETVDSAFPPLQQEEETGKQSLGKTEVTTTTQTEKADEPGPGPVTEDKPETTVETEQQVEGIPDKPAEEVKDLNVDDKGKVIDEKPESEKPEPSNDGLFAKAEPEPSNDGLFAKAEPAATDEKSKAPVAESSSEKTPPNSAYELYGDTMESLVNCNTLPALQTITDTYDEKSLDVDMPFDLTKSLNKAFKDKRDKIRVKE
jgi:hypothetical protein